MERARSKNVDAVIPLPFVPVSVVDCLVEYFLASNSTATVEGEESLISRVSAKFRRDMSPPKSRSSLGGEKDETVLFLCVESASALCLHCCSQPCLV